MHHKTCLFTWAAGQDAPGRDFRGAAPNLTLLFPHASEGRRRSLRLAFLPLWQGAQIKLVSHTSLCSPTPQSCFQCWKKERERDTIKPALLCVCARAWIPWSSGQVDFVTTLRTGLSTFGFWHFSAGAQTKLVFWHQLLFCTSKNGVQCGKTKWSTTKPAFSHELHDRMRQGVTFVEQRPNWLYDCRFRGRSCALRFCNCGRELKLSLGNVDTAEILIVFDFGSKIDFFFSILWSKIDFFSFDFGVKLIYIFQFLGPKTKGQKWPKNAQKYWNVDFDRFWSKTSGL